MNLKVADASLEDFPISIIGKIAGGKFPLLPGESAEEYSNGLRATLAELEAKSPLQIYLAEKIFDCIWWVRRLEAQKTEAITDRMCELIKLKIPKFSGRKLLSEGNWSSPLLSEVLALMGHTPESLVLSGIRGCGEFLERLDARIADRIKAMQGLQASYEALVNRRFVSERLRLQNANLKRDLAAIESRLVVDDE